MIEVKQERRVKMNRGLVAFIRYPKYLKGKQEMVHLVRPDRQIKSRRYSSCTALMLTDNQRTSTPCNVTAVSHNMQILI